MYYSKFHCNLNHIQYFWYNKKSKIRKNCKYNIKQLRNDIFKVLAQVKRSTILRHYKNCLKKKVLYRNKI